jgi:hypothetical protein
MPDFNAQNTDAENAKGAPSVKDVGGVKLVSSRSAQAIAKDDPRDTTEESPSRVLSNA